MRLVPDRLVAGGEAMARADDGRIVFVEGALPGEIVEVEIRTTKKDYARAVVVEVVQPSPDREHPSCPHRRAGCGGCDWMHLRPSAQLDAKAVIVAESLRRIGRLPPDVVDDLVVRGRAVEPLGYRTTIRVVGSASGSAGLRAQGSHDVVPVDSCPVADPALSRLLPGLGIDPGVELTLRSSVSTGAVTAIWDHEHRREHRRSVRGLPAGVHVGARAWLSERVAGVDLRVSARSFFQSGVQAAELLVAAVSTAAPELADARHAVDAYGGVGVFAATAMANAGHVTVIESARSACVDAEHNLAGRSARIVHAEVARWTPRASEGATSRAPGGRGPSADVVVADPARPGLGRPGVTSLVAAAAPVLVLVSCDPVSLARDVSLLGAAGYRPERVEVLDLFPNTHHVETVTRFVRAED
jgi:23S rRNA (uracil1939-C5)-methyltransferase